MIQMLWGFSFSLTSWKTNTFFSCEVACLFPTPFSLQNSTQLKKKLLLKPHRTLTFFYLPLLSLLEENRRPLKISIQVKIKVIKKNIHMHFWYFFKQTTTRKHKNNECITVTSKVPKWLVKSEENREVW